MSRIYPAEAASKANNKADNKADSLFIVLINFYP